MRSSLLPSASSKRTDFGVTCIVNPTSSRICRRTTNFARSIVPSLPSGSTDGLIAQASKVADGGRVKGLSGVQMDRHRLACGEQVEPRQGGEIPLDMEPVRP